MIIAENISPYSTLHIRGELSIKNNFIIIFYESTFRGNVIDKA